MPNQKKVEIFLQPIELQRSIFSALFWPSRSKIAEWVKI